MLGADRRGMMAAFLWKSSQEESDGLVRGCIEGYWFELRRICPGTENESLTELAGRVYRCLRADGFAHLEPQEEFIRGFLMGSMCPEYRKEKSYDTSSK